LLSEILLEVKNLKIQSEEFRTEKKKELLDLKNGIKARDENWEAKFNSLDSKISNVESKTDESIRHLVDKIQVLGRASSQKRKEKQCDH
jgi:hypothetical protein